MVKVRESPGSHTVVSPHASRKKEKKSRRGKRFRIKKKEPVKRRRKKREQRGMYDSLQLVLLLPILLLVVAHFILLLLRLQHVTNLSLFVVSIPAYVAYGGGIILFSGLALLLRGISMHDRLLMGGLVFLLLGSFVSQLLVSDKIEVDPGISWTAALVPFMVGVLIACIFVLAALLVKRRDKARGQADTSAPLLPRDAPPRTSHARAAKQRLIVARPAKSGRQ
jgi:hypothetical protein